MTEPERRFVARQAETIKALNRAKALVTGAKGRTWVHVATLADAQDLVEQALVILEGEV